MRRHQPARWRLHVVLRPELRDAGGDSRRENPRRRSRRHVDRARGDPGAARGLRCAAVSLVTNFAAGLAGGDPSHEETQAVAAARPPTASSASCAPSSRAHDEDLSRHDPAAGNHPRQARRRGLERGRDRRLHRRPHGGRGDRRPGRRLRDGDLLSRHDARGARRADAGDDALRLEPRLARREPARPDSRQALDRRRRRQCQPDAGADARRLRRLCADDFRPRPRPYRRHARQARFDPGYASQPDLALFRRVVTEAGCAIIGQTADLAPADRRLYAIRDVTATVEFDRADHRLDPVEEARRRPARRWSWT